MLLIDLILAGVIGGVVYYTVSKIKPNVKVKKGMVYLKTLEIYSVDTLDYTSNSDKCSNVTIQTYFLNYRNNKGDVKIEILPETYLKLYRQHTSLTYNGNHHVMLLDKMMTETDLQQMMLKHIEKKLDTLV